MKTTILTTTAVALIVCLNTAHADYMTYRGTALTSTVKINAENTLANHLSVHAGQMQVSLTDTLGHATDYIGYCVDLNHYAGSGAVDVATTYILRNGSLAAWLYVMYAPSVTTGTQAAALQSAIWEVTNETMPTFDIASGYFSISDNATVAQAAQAMLNNLPVASALRLNVFNSAQCQDLLVPEPMTFTLIALGGTLCLLRRR